MTKQRLSFLGKLGKDERGSIVFQAIFFTIGMMVMIGLALDGARLTMLHSDLQKLADAAALAGAAKLDGTANATDRATTAANGVVNNVRWWDVSGVNIASVQFYSSLNPDTPAPNSKTAGYIKVTTGTWEVAPSIFAGA